MFLIFPFLRFPYLRLNPPHKYLCCYRAQLLLRGLVCGKITIYLRVSPTYFAHANNKNIKIEQEILQSEIEKKNISRPFFK
jgi:hypothetical protein